MNLECDRRFPMLQPHPRHRQLLSILDTVYSQSANYVIEKGNSASITKTYFTSDIMNVWTGRTSKPITCCPLFNH